ncbi:hypothetical protein GCM10018790_51570 [Kitasatospora xanthocidica]|uniref:hypothetical protein n=1 Tax=Kitasatospora xanthocidica TaxID=83382 RepID=UPI00167B8130|nr:hypothetical protein [Kitasatospora xanthocidica]GHF67301.1 hypothetical protein GCM10018790_51570 [Kitasatospora xanthocidica]
MAGGRAVTPERALAVLMGVLAEVADAVGSPGSPGSPGGEPALLGLVDDEPDRLSDLGQRLAATGWTAALHGSGA